MANGKILVQSGRRVYTISTPKRHVRRSLFMKEIMAIMRMNKVNVPKGAG